MDASKDVVNDTQQVGVERGYHALSDPYTRRLGIPAIKIQLVMDGS